MEQRGMEQHPDIAEMRARYDMLTQRPTGQYIETLAMLTGLYLAISPWVVGFSVSARDLAMNNLICGLAVSLLALGFATAYGRTHGLSWVTPVLGVWTIVAPWAVLGSQAGTGTILSNIICGVIIAALGVATSAMGSGRAMLRLGQAKTSAGR